MTDLDSMSKDDLAGYARETCGVEIDKRKKREVLIAEIKAMGEPGEEAAEPEPAPTGYLKHPKTGHIFKATALLLRRGDLVPCNGKRV